MRVTIVFHDGTERRFVPVPEGFEYLRDIEMFRVQLADGLVSIPRESVKMVLVEQI